MSALRVLVAEDDALQRQLLCGFLEAWGHVPIQAVDGEAALAALAASDAPRLALIDWEMPGVDGPTVCSRLRARSGPPIYCLLLTVRHDVEDQLAGLEAGAHDFIPKPFFPETVRCRVDVWARILAAEAERTRHLAQLHDYSTRMEALAEERARALVHAERLATLGTLAAGVAHEINNPATVISGNAQLLRRFWQRIEPVIAVQRAADPQLAFAVTETPRLLAAAEDAVSRIARIVRALQAYGRSGGGERRPIAVETCIDEALELCAHRLRRHVRLQRERAAPAPVVLGDAQQIEQVLVNLVVNAADAIGDAEGMLRISTAVADGRVRIAIEDNGPGLPGDLGERIWEPFVTTKPVGHGTGLGLSISQGIVAAHGGSIAAANRPEGGARFLIDLPAAPAREPPP